MALEIAAIARFHYKRLSLGSISRTSIRCALLEIHSMNRCGLLWIVSLSFWLFAWYDQFSKESGFLSRFWVASESFLDDYRFQFPRPAFLWIPSTVRRCDSHAPDSLYNQNLKQTYLIFNCSMLFDWSTRLASVLQMQGSRIVPCRNGIKLKILRWKW